MARVLRIARQHVETVSDIDIRHIAERDDLREADIVLRRPVDQRSRDGAGLRQQRDIAWPGCHMREPGIELHWRDHQAQRVRPDDAEKGGLGGVEHRLAQSVLARQPGGDDDCRPRALVSEFAHDTGNRLGRRYDHPQIGNTWQIRRLRIAAPTGDFSVLRIDRPDLALEAAADDVVEDDTADRAVAHRCAEHGNRLGGERMFKIPDRHPCFSRSWR